MNTLPVLVYKVNTVLMLCPSVSLSSCQCALFCLEEISWTAQSFLTKLIWWYIIIWQSAMQKKICSLSEISRSQQGLSYCWSICYYTWHDKPGCHVENWITGFKVKVTVKVQNVSECLSRWYLLNHRTFCYQFGIVMQQHDPECCSEKKRKKVF